MIVLDEDCVIEAKAMVAPATTAHRVLFKVAKPRRGLAGVNNDCASAFDGVDIGACQRGDAAKPDHQVQSDPLSGQKRARVRLYPSQPLTCADAGCIFDLRLENC